MTEKRQDQQNQQQFGLQPAKQGEIIVPQPQEIQSPQNIPVQPQQVRVEYVPVPVPIQQAPAPPPPPTYVVVQNYATANAEARSSITAPGCAGCAVVLAACAVFGFVVFLFCSGVLLSGSKPQLAPPVSQPTPGVVAPPPALRILAIGDQVTAGPWQITLARAQLGRPKVASPTGYVQTSFETAFLVEFRLKNTSEAAQKRPGITLLSVLDADGKPLPIYTESGKTIVFEENPVAEVQPGAEITIGEAYLPPKELHGTVVVDTGALGGKDSTSKWLWGL